MGAIDIGWISLGLGMLLMVVPVFFLWKLRTGLVTATLTGTLRMCVQLALIGVYLQYLFLWNSPWLNLLWVIVMVWVAAHTAVSHTRLRRDVLFLPAFAGFMITAVIVGLFFLGVVLRLDNVFSSRYFIPVIGILLGNMLSVNVVALNAYYTELYREQQMFYYLLGNGASRLEATLPFLRSAVVKSFSPCIANLAVMGIVSYPGTMIGQILGGSSPDVAIKYQMMIVVITVASSMMSLMLTVGLSARKSFDDYGCLKAVFQQRKCK
ncbi:MAG: ABC transporter permease [Clostridium sp.]|nr:ABC transporter permease [Clostridium sp.]